MISRLKNQVQDVLDSDAVLENMSEAEKQVTLTKAKLIKNLPAITASLKLLVEIMIWITVSFTAFWTMQKIALRREFNRQLGELIFFTGFSEQVHMSQKQSSTSIREKSKNFISLSVFFQFRSSERHHIIFKNFMNYEINYDVISYHEFNSESFEVNIENSIVKK